MRARIRRLPAPDQPETAIDGDVVLVAEGRDGKIDGRHRSILLRLRLGELDSPARIPVLVAQLRRLVLPGFGYLAGLDVGFLRLRIALARSGHQRGVDDLT